MIRAILEGCGYGLRQLTGVAEEMIGMKISGFISIGGGSKSEVWSQIKADIMGKHIDILDIENVAPIGAALLAGVGCGMFGCAKEAEKWSKRKSLNGSNRVPPVEKYMTTILRFTHDSIRRSKISTVSGSTATDGSRRIGQGAGPFVAPFRP